MNTTLTITAIAAATAPALVWQVRRAIRADRAAAIAQLQAIHGTGPQPGPDFTAGLDRLRAAIHEQQEGADR
ncbi:hypothetical protein [Streptomyces sp. NPDC002573]|uniref:hypothetical protein n=1 Tax=Streptomyces sp. NPDC002573 TaxID=3364651 RepID=UPI0036A62960